MSESQRKSVEYAVKIAYETNQPQYAYYLELCLRVGEMPR